MIIIKILGADSVDYLLGGSLVMKDGLINKYLFDEGYAQATAANPTTYSFSFYYYNQDHLGNNREVVDASGTVQQVTNYYPFGTPYTESSTVMDASLQPYKYNGKELDRMHGLNTYDYGARQYNPVLGRWDRVDPLCEKYYSVSPYAYCHNNPVMLVDPDGMDDYFNEKGEFVERTEIGSNVLVMYDDQYKNITDVDFSNNYSIIENIGRHYLAKSDKNDFNLTASSTGDKITIDAVFSNDTGTENYNIYLTNGYVNKSLGNYYNFQCIAFHESTHRYDRSTHGGTIGEAYAILRTANECPAWLYASDDYIISQASYAAESLNLYARNNNIPINIVQRLNQTFMGYAIFELNNNYLTKSNLLDELTIWGTKR